MVGATTESMSPTMPIARDRPRTGRSGCTKPPALSVPPPNTIDVIDASSSSTWPAALAPVKPAVTYGSA